MPAVCLPDVVSAIEPPRCPDCGKTMRLESSDPNIYYANLDQLKFVCDCGHTTEKIVAHY
jgi:C4-type Zn-finger protein